MSSNSRDRARTNLDATPNIRSFANFPLHILTDIASRTDQVTIWSLMATSRGVREAAELALRPYLKTLTVLESPPYFPSVHNALDRRLFVDDEDDKVRRAGLRFQYYKQRKHLVAYPPGLTLIRNLVLEVRDDDDELGWPIIRDVSAQLESLELQIYDRYCEQPGIEVYLATQGHTEEAVAEWIAKWGGVPDLLSDWSVLLAGPVSFQNLTHLTLSSTARGLHHLLRLAPHIPSIVSLVWSCYWLGESDYNIGSSDYTVDAALPFPKLESLSVSAGPVIVRWMTKALLRHTPNIRNLTVYRGREDSDREMFTGEIRGIFESIRTCQTLQGIALYSILADPFISEAMALRLETPHSTDFERITSLALERLIPTQGPMEGNPVYPLLEYCDTDLSIFPNLEHITWVNPDTGEDGEFTLGWGNNDQTEFFDDRCLESLFTLYPHLSQVQWLAGYPVNPFLVATAENWDELNVKCFVRRPSTVNDPLLPIFTKADFHSPQTGDISPRDGEGKRWSWC